MITKSNWENKIFQINIHVDILTEYYMYIHILIIDQIKLLH